jgi:hypothetical protein
MRNYKMYSIDLHGKGELEQRSEIRFGKFQGIKNELGLLIIEPNILPISEDLFVNIL